jgi:hypothetical protein
MSLGRTITIDCWAKREEGAYGLLVEYEGQAPILMETEGCDSSLHQVKERMKRFHGRPHRWCIVRLVPVDGNELLALDFERLQALKKEPQE